jgi:hypothetical protein
MTISRSPILLFHPPPLHQPIASPISRILLYASAVAVAANPSRPFSTFVSSTHPGLVDQRRRSNELRLALRCGISKFTGSELNRHLRHCQRCLSLGPLVNNSSTISIRLGPGASGIESPSSPRKLPHNPALFLSPASPRGTLRAADSTPEPVVPLLPESRLSPNNHQVRSVGLHRL